MESLIKSGRFHSVYSLMREITLYLYVKNIIIESDKIKCEFNDGKRVIRCSQFDNEFTIGFKEMGDKKCLDHRFTIFSLYEPEEEKQVLLFLLEKIFINIFDNDFIFYAVILKGKCIFHNSDPIVKYGPYFYTKLIDDKLILNRDDYEEDYSVFLEKMNRTLD